MTKDKAKELENNPLTLVPLLEEMDQLRDELEFLKEENKDLRFALRELRKIEAEKLKKELGEML